MTLKINGQTKVFGIFGWPVEHSFSPAMHNSAFAKLGMDCAYVPFPVQPDNIEKAVDAIRSLGISGVNVTIPHKSSVMRFLDEVSQEAKLIGAVNTIVNRNGVLTGYNTDAPGFLKSLEKDAGVKPASKKVLILGAGGAARAVSIQLALAGAAEIAITSPVEGEAERLADSIIESSLNVKVSSISWDKGQISKCTGDSDILINATPVGMHPRVEEMPPVDFENAAKDLLVCDLIYNPDKTMLLKVAGMRGLKTLNGMGMLLYQGAIAFELWTGTEPPLEIMREALQKSLAK